MKICSSKRASKQGSIFLVALGMTALFALVLSSYLCLAESQADSVARNQSFDLAIPVAEAGVEEAFSLINKNGGASTWSNNLASDGWSAMTASNTTTKSNLVFGANYYQVTISNAPGTAPVITSAGVVPYIQHAWGIEMTTNTTINTALVPLVRTLQITTVLTPALGAAIEAKGDILFSGGANVDSFNSRIPSLSSNGQYNVNFRDDKATVATDGKVTSAIAGSGGVTIRGYVATGPGGTIAPGTSSIGDMNWVSNATAGVEASRSNNNFNVSFPDVAAPTATFVETPTSGTVGGTNYNMVLQGNQYWGTSNVMYQSTVNIPGGQKAVVTGGAVTLYIPPTGTLNFSGSGFICVTPGSSVKIYCASPSATLSGSSFVGSTNAVDVAIYGLTNLTTITYSGGSAYIGTIYAPEANFTGSGSDAIIGALMANTFTFTGSAAIHYDESLGGATASTYVANNWQEIARPVYYQELAP